MSTVGLIGAGAFGEADEAPSFDDPRGRLKEPQWYQRFLVADFVVCFLLCIAAGLVKLIPPFEGEVFEKDPELSFPLRPDSVPMAACSLVGGAAPIVVFLLAFKLFYKDSADLIRSNLGFFQSISIALFSTAFFKNLIGRPRPNFFALCNFYEGECHASISIISRARRSFPSGHTSFAFSGLFYLTLYLLGKSRIACSLDRDTVASRSFSSWSSISLRCIVCLLPTFVAGFIGATRTRDYWHHYSDVLAGAVLGIICAVFGYRLNFPTIFHWTSPDVAYRLPGTANAPQDALPV